MDVSFLGGPHPQRGIGIVAPFDFALDRELWRWVPDEVSLHLTRTPYVPVEVSLDLARLVSEHQTLRAAVHALSAAEPEVLAYACTSGSFVDGMAGERTMSAAMEAAGEVPALTTSGALLEALAELRAQRIALVTPYTASVTEALEDYLAEAGITVVSQTGLGLTRHIWKVAYREVVEMARHAVPRDVDALIISCTNLPTYDVIPQLEAELRMPVVSANQVTMWAALRRIGAGAVGPYQTLIDESARRMLRADAPLADAPRADAPATAGAAPEEPTGFAEPPAFPEPPVFPDFPGAE
ncbi:aspartate/glutamate racemase family protein [Streptomyces sp. B-S-A8]|uniref:Aspartate/glutamate racemase family protein n=1 Tax=Streptomyces solicavernae TaxID=3043614 RepID=A0ABT6RR90_9ACTN|nr:aspartate/glutamate racemase family protein [Streptomyces sp. B-S-A8]MDI3386958.1 aspartate/glutamate racemase family protein [Streptomyces sp. B-S-A8]